MNKFLEKNEIEEEENEEEIFRFFFIYSINNYKRKTSLATKIKTI